MHVYFLWRLKEHCEPNTPTLKPLPHTLAEHLPALDSALDAEMNKNQSLITGSSQEAAPDSTQHL